MLEVCFIDSAADVNTYQSKKDSLINTIVNGIAEGFGLKQLTVVSHWAERYYKRLNDLGYVIDNDWKQYDCDLPTSFALALLDKATGGMKDTYVGRNADHCSRNCLDSLCDKAIITTPAAFTDFEAGISYGCFLALICGAFKI